MIRTALLLVVLLAVAACGGGESTTTTVVDATTTEAGDATPEPGDETTTTTGADTTTTAEADTADGAGGELPVRACELVPDADVAAFLGVEVVGEPGGLAEFGGNPLVDDCLWQNQSTFENFSIQFFGDQRGLDEMEFSDEEFGIAWDVVDYPGIGDGALTLTDPETGDFNSLWVETGPYVIACYSDPFADAPVVVDGDQWGGFLALCETALGNATA